MNESNEIKVTVAILAHNQITYIEQAIESVLEQKTNFRYEILIHDDCSTDGTRGIIEEYAERYPTIIVPILEKENQYVKGNDYLQYAIWRYVRGEYYIALDGDDYWCDCYKLQKQVDYLDAHPEYIAHTHLTKKINENNGEVGWSPTYRENDKEWSDEEIIDWFDVFQTSSLMYRSYIQGNIPRSYISFFAQDYPVALWLCVEGKIAYSSWVMTVHRMNAIGSYSSEFFGDDDVHNSSSVAREHLNIRSKLLEEFSHDTDHKYDDVIRRSSIRREFEILWSEHRYDDARDNEYYKNMKFRKKCFFFLDEHCPKLVELKNAFMKR